MNHVFLFTRIRHSLAAGFLGLFFAGSFYLAPQASAPESTIGRLLGEAEEEDERPKEDRPDLAVEQDAELTRDPATGEVPRERLLAAARYNEMRLAQLRPTAGALSAANWTERGPTNVAGRIRGLLIDPSDASGNTIWVGSAGGGLWKGTNATTRNVQWTNVNSFLTHLSVSTVASTPAGTAPQVLYCGTGEGFFNADAIQGAGIWKSTDGGATWNQLAATNNPSFYHVQKVLVHPVTLDVYAATRTGLWRSRNAGTSWTLVLAAGLAPGAVTSRVADIEIAADNTLFASLGLFSSDGIYRSTSGDAGDWTKLNTMTGSGLPTAGYQRIELACAPSDANRVYALFESATNRGLLNMYRSLDKGTTWALMARPGATTTAPTFDFTRSQAWYDLIAAVSPTDPDLLYVGGIDLWRTTNAGEATATQVTWTQASRWNISPASALFVHADHHAIAFLPTASGPADRAFFGNDGGIFYSSNASGTGTTTPTFASRNSGLNVTQYYSLAMHPTNYNYFLAGAQDNGTQQFSTPGLNVAATATGGDGGYCAIDQVAPNVQITSYVYNQYWRSVNGGASFATYFIEAKGSFINPFDYDSRNGALYAAYSNDTCFVWTNAGSRTQTTPVILKNRLAPGIGRITHVAVSPEVAKRIYVGTNSGQVLRVDSASTSAPVVTVLRPAAPGTSVSCIAIDPANEDHLLVTYANYGIVSVYETLNASLRTPLWTSVEGSLPDMPVRWALIDPNNPARALLATEMGVYSTEQLSGSATSWTPANSSLANTRVSMLRYRAGDQLVAAATHGRGLYTSDLFAATPLASKATNSSMVSSVYPNPFTTEVNVNLAQKAIGPVSVTLTDALGRRAFATTLAPNGTLLKLALPAGLAPGNYVLLVGNNGQQTSRRLVKR